MSKSMTLLIAIMLLSALIIHAEVPQLINYQGMLSDAEDNPVTAQNLSIVFSIYDSETEGTSLWSETQMVNVTDGVFNVLLGSVTPIPYEVFDGSDRYLSMKIGEDSEMTPRKHLVSVGNAFHAHTADNVAVGNYVETVNGVSPNESGNIAVVAGDNVDVSATSSGIKISWQVTGVRNDPAAKANPPQAEQAKSTEDAGYYLHPKAYSASEAQGISGRQQIKLRQEYEEIDRERKILSEKQREIEARDAQHQAEMEKQMEAEKQQRKDLRSG